MIASDGASTASMIADKMPAMNEAQTPMPSARPGLPERAMGKASKVVAIAEGVPGMPISAQENRPPVSAPT